MEAGRPHDLQSNFWTSHWEALCKIKCSSNQYKMIRNFKFYQSPRERPIKDSIVSKVAGLKPAMLLPAELQI